MSTALADRRKARTGSDTLRLIIADDDPDVRHLLEIVLETDRFEIVATAKNGAEAIVAALETKPDVVILDYMMPEVGGEEAGMVIRDALPHTVVVGFSVIDNRGCRWAHRFIDKANIADMSTLVEDAYLAYAV